MASDESKTTSQMISGYSIRQGYVQKMAPGDKKFHLVTYEGKVNKMNQYPTREQADEAYDKLDASVPRILVAGETGDVLRAKGETNWVNQCLGMFLT